METIEAVEGPAQIFAWIAMGLLVAGWIMCLVHGFGRSAMEGVLLIIFGNPCCCCINYITLLIYSFAVYSGDKKWWPRALVGTAFLIVVVVFIVRFSVIWPIITNPGAFQPPGGGP